MPTIDKPRKPMIQMFTPFADRAYVDANPYIDDGTHLDTEWVIKRLSPAADIYSNVEGAGVTSAGVVMDLVPGVVYVARMRYQNETGWSAWSKNYAAAVASDLDFEAMPVPGEPTTNGAIPIIPDFVMEKTSSRKIREWRMQTAHLKRRLIETGDRKSLRMAWLNLSAADKVTLRTFLNDRIRAAEGFTTDDDFHGAEGWFPRAATLETQLKEMSPGGGVWNATIDVVNLY